MRVLLEFAFLEFAHHLAGIAGFLSDGAQNGVLLVDGGFEVLDPLVFAFDCGFELVNALSELIELVTEGFECLGVVLEPIVDASVYEEICDNEDFHYLLDNSAYERYQLSRLEDSLTLGIGLYDDRKIAIGAYNEVGEGNHIAVLISSHEDLIEWGTQVYETYSKEALSPVESDY